MQSLCCNLVQAVVLVLRRRAVSATTTMTIGRRGAAKIVMTMTARGAVKWDRPCAAWAAGRQLAGRKVAGGAMCAAPVVPDEVDSLAVQVAPAPDLIEWQECAAGHVAPAEAAFLVGRVQVRALDEAWVRPESVRVPQPSPSSFSDWNASSTRCCAN